MDGPLIQNIMASGLTPESDRPCSSIDIRVSCSCLRFLWKWFCGSHSAACSHACCRSAGRQGVRRLSTASGDLYLSRPWGNIGKESFGLLLFQNVQKCRTLILNLYIDVCNIVLWNSSSWNGPWKLDSHGTEPSTTQFGTATPRQPTDDGGWRRFGNIANCH